MVLRWSMLVILGALVADVTSASLVEVELEVETHGEVKALPPPCSSGIYCSGDLLHAVQMSNLFHDSKTFVDKKLKVPANQVLGNFSLLLEASNGQPTPEQLGLFVGQYFDPEGSEFEAWDPSDWTSNPKFLENIKDPQLQQWAGALNEAWKFLGRKIKDDVKLNPDLYSMIYVPNPVIVPGGRFREFYYWDSYWIVEGLLLSEMHTTVKGMLENFLLMVERYGMIPNGGRIYYENRSQPPFLIPMVEKYFNVTGDLQFIEDNIHILEKEMEFWLSNRTVNVNGHTLARFNVESDGPRPESYKEDYLESANMSATDRQDFYMNMKSGAESGWDFSTRWYLRKDNVTKANLTHIKTRYIVPVDLNAFLCMNARILSNMFQRLQNSSKAEYYLQLSRQWKQAIDQVLWNEELGSWFDFDLLTNSQRQSFYASNLVPLWTGCWDPLTPAGNSTVDKILDYLSQSQVLNFPGGVPTSMQQSGQQWDFPNGWPPLQHMLVFGLEATNDPRAQQIALELAQRWIRNNYEAYMQSMPNAMFEKYDVTVVGLPGGGGEYDVQLGFGWTNGVVMELLDKYGDRLASEPLEPKLDTEEGSVFSRRLNDGTSLLAWWTCIVAKLIIGWTLIKKCRRSDGVKPKLN